MKVGHQIGLENRIFGIISWDWGFRLGVAGRRGGLLAEIFSGTLEGLSQ